MISTDPRTKLSPNFLGSLLLSVSLLGIALISLHAEDSDEMAERSDESMQQSLLDEEEVDDEPDPFRKTPRRRRERKKAKEKSSWFQTSSSVLDGPGIIGQGGHLAFKSFGRNDSITPIEGMPYVLTDEHFFFGDVRGFVSNTSTFGGNAGIGYRHLREDWNSWFGGSVFYDVDGTSGKSFQQIGVSLEAMVERWEFRSNIYVPTSSMQTFSNSINSPHISGNQLMFGQYINQGKALTGVDFEAGYNIPVMEPHRLRAFAGYYRFDGAASGAVNGFKARLEGVVNNTVTAQVMFTTDPLFGSNVMVGCQFQLPFGQSHPSSRWEQNTPSPFRFVERNYNVIVGHQVSNNGSVVAINPATNNPYNVEVVSTTAAPGGNGSTAHPFSTIDAAQSAGADVIFVQGNSVISSPITLATGQRLIGDGSLTNLPLPGGRSVQLPNLIAASQTPTISGISGSAVTLSSNAQISGFNFSNIIGDGITGNNVSNGQIQNVSFQKISGDAINLTNSTGNFVLNGITVNSAGGDGLHFSGGSANLTFSGSVSGTQKNGIELANLSGGVVNINNATISSTGGTGLLLNSVATNVTVTSLTTSETQGPAVSIMNGPTSNLYDFVHTTTIQTPNGIGFNISGTQANVTVDNLVVTSTAGSPAVSAANSTGTILFSNLDLNTTNATGLSANALSSLTVTNGTITTVNAAAIDVQDSTATMKFTNVSVNGGPFGIRLIQDVGSFTLAGSTSTYASSGTIQNTNTGLILNTAGTVNISWLDLLTNGVGIQSSGNNQLEMSGLRIENSTGYAFDSLNDSVTMLENSLLTGNGSLGNGTIRQQVGTVATYQWLIQGNTINDANGTPILMTTQPAGAGASLAVTVQQNTIVGSRGGNSLINMNWNGPLSALVSTNTLTAQSANMTGVNIAETSTIDTAVGHVTNNTMTFADIKGTGVMMSAPGSNTYQVDNNTITFNGVDGIGLHFNLTGTSTTWIYSNSITDSAGGATGMLFDNVAASSRVQIEGNSITLLSTDVSVHRGIIFTSVSPTIQFAGNSNNVISNTPTPFSIPVNSSTGEIIVNGTLVP